MASRPPSYLLPPPAASVDGCIFPMLREHALHTTSQISNMKETRNSKLE